MVLLQIGIAAGGVVMSVLTDVVEDGNESETEDCECE